MALKAAASRIVGAALTSRLARDLNRLRHRKAGQPVIDYFHQVDDPYSHLAAQVLAPLAHRYGVKIRPWLVPPPDDAAAPERERLRDHALRDAPRVAYEYGLTFPAAVGLPDPTAVAEVAAVLAQGLGGPDFAAGALAAGEALWTGSVLPASARDPAATLAAALAAGEAERRRLGHYLGAMFHFEGEWYWGVDRLNHLEERLTARGLDSAPPIAPFRDLTLAPAPPNRSGTRPLIEFWFSFRSPYSQIAFPRVRRLARHYGADLQLRYILPMVMRGLPVPRMKRLYIVRDTKREAERVGQPFGRMVDPVGRGAERALAVIHAAVPLGLAEEFGERATRAAFGEGVDLAEDRGLYAVARACGLSSEQVDDALADDDGWRATAEANRAALFDAGLWGAPSYRVNGAPAHWGQDRLWALEQDLRRALTA